MEIKTEPGLFMKMNGSGCWFCGINVGDKSCVGISVEFHSGDTWPHARACGYERVTPYQDKPDALCCIHRCNLYCMVPVLRPGPYYSSHFNGEKEHERNGASFY